MVSRYKIFTTSYEFIEEKQFNTIEEAKTYAVYNDVIVMEIIK